MGQFRSSILTRPTLLIRLKNPQDQKSWQEFYDTYWRMIYGLAIRSGLSDPEAQDVLQETIITVAEKMPNFHYDPTLGSFKGWLLTITRSRIIDSLRKIKREHAYRAPRTPTDRQTSSVERIADPASLDFDAIWDQQWKEGIYEVAIDRIREKISAKQFQLFDCYVRKQWKAETVAEFAGVPVSQVHLAKCRVTKMLAKEVRQLETRNT